jgi:hypothetical protein
VFQSKCFFFANAMMRNGEWKPMTCEMWISFFVKKKTSEIFDSIHTNSVYSIFYYTLRYIHTLRDRAIKYIETKRGGGGEGDSTCGHHQGIYIVCARMAMQHLLNKIEKTLNLCFTIMWSMKHVWQSADSFHNEVIKYFQKYYKRLNLLTICIVLFVKLSF